MKKTDLLIGFCIGIVVALLGTTVLLLLLSKFRFFSYIDFIKSDGMLGKIITLSTLLNVVIFFILLQKNKEMMARGIILATITLAILTLFV